MDVFYRVFPVWTTLSHRAEVGRTRDRVQSYLSYPTACVINMLRLGVEEEGEEDTELTLVRRPKYRDLKPTTRRSAGRKVREIRRERTVL